MVGDSYQSIYEWRGAVNAFDSIPDTFKRLYLTESFRFTPEIAELATKLTSIAGNDRPIIGKAEVKPVKTSAIIVRTNASIIDYLLAAVQENYKVHVVADLQDLWSKLYHLSALGSGSKPKFPNAELRRFNTIGEFATEAERNPDLKRLATLSFKMSQGRGTHGNIVAIKGVLAETPAEGKFTIVTSHKSKGLEFDAVTLDMDMLRETEEGGIDDLVKLLKDNQTLNLLYVAMTRAKYQLTLPANVYDIFDNLEVLTELWDKTASN
jgi:superfamily I DNA/RNA helicase